MRDGNVAISLVYRAERYIPPHLERNILVSYIYKHPEVRGKVLFGRGLFSQSEGLNHIPFRRDDLLMSKLGSETSRQRTRGSRENVRCAMET